MFGKYINRKQDQLSSFVELDEAKNFITEVLDNEKIDKSIKHYINSEIDWWIYKVKKARFGIKYFDIEDPELISEFNKLDTILKRKAILNKKEFLVLLEESIKARFNILLRPRVALSWFVFRDNIELLIEDINNRLKYFNDYKYFYDGFLNWVNDNSILENEYLSINDFNKVITEIDNNYIFDLDADKLLSELDPLFEIFDYKNAEDKYLLPIEALIVFFDDKAISQLVDKFDELVNEENIEFLDKTNLLEIIKSLTESNEEEGSIVDSDYNIESEEIEELEVTDQESDNIDMSSEFVDENIDDGNSDYSNSDDGNLNNNKLDDGSTDKISLEEESNFDILNEETLQSDESEKESISLDMESAFDDSQLDVNPIEVSEDISENELESDLIEGLNEESNEESITSNIQTDNKTEVVAEEQMDMPNDEDLIQEIVEDTENEMDSAIEINSDSNPENMEEDFSDIADSILNPVAPESPIEVNKKIIKANASNDNDEELLNSIDEISEILTNSIDSEDYVSIEEYPNNELNNPTDLQKEFLNVLNGIDK